MPQVEISMRISRTGFIEFTQSEINEFNLRLNNTSEFSFMNQGASAHLPHALSQSQSQLLVVLTFAPVTVTTELCTACMDVNLNRVHNNLSC